MNETKNRKCTKCNHEWVARIDLPKSCPSCHSWLWDGRAKRFVKRGAKSYGCKIDGCNRKHYAKELCSKHWVKQWRTLNPQPRQQKECKAFEHCHTLTIKEYCSKHIARIKNNKSLDLSIDYRVRELSHFWNNGSSEYKDHSYFKRQRLIILEQAGYKCEHCDNEATHVHHLDKSRDNHELENLKAVCCKCHKRVYHLKYGLPVSEIAELAGCSASMVSLHLNGNGKSLKWRDKINKVMERNSDGKM